MFNYSANIAKKKSSLFHILRELKFPELVQALKHQIKVEVQVKSTMCFCLNPGMIAMLTV